MSSEIAFFINQNSGSGKASAVAEAAEHSLPGLRIQSILPKSALELSESCTQLQREKVKAAVVFGGDGTQTYALRGLLESGIPLYPFPSGTANDLAKEQGITGSIEQFQKLVEEESIEQIRVLGVNGIPFSTVAGIGIGSDLCSEYNTLRSKYSIFKKVSQRLNCEIYSALAVKNIFSKWGKGHRVHIKADGFDEVLTVSSIMICNQSTLAGNLKVAPDQKKDSEDFTVLIHPEACGFATLKGLAEMKLGNINDSFISIKTKNLVIENLDGKSMNVFGDGEILTESTTLTFNQYPKKLNIFGVRHLF
jgi:diacylglycerol kinase family enzyme